MIFHAFWLPNVLFDGVVKDAGEVDSEGCGRLSVHDGLLGVAWFCVCKLGGSFAAEMNVSWVVVVGESASALGDIKVCVTSMHYIKSIRMFEDDVT